MSIYLDSKNLQIDSASDGTLRAQIEGDRCAVRLDVLRAFPISHADENIVLRDGGGKEIGILQDLKSLDSATRALLETALANRYFLPRITRIDSIFERFGSAVWEVDTDRGPTTITTKALHEAIYEVSPTRFLLRDIEENRFEIPDVNALDAVSKSRFLGKI
ncbi:DUF1854 domain-containing protein [bacterium]|nr:MAG: DUF1854 domain-containing protein [bacterium]